MWNCIDCCYGSPRWIGKFGGAILEPEEWEGPEVSPLRSYLGESLGSVYNRAFSQPYDEMLQVVAIAFIHSRANYVFTAI